MWSGPRRLISPHPSGLAPTQLLSSEGCYLNRRRLRRKSLNIAGQLVSGLLKRGKRSMRQLVFELSKWNARFLSNYSGRIAMAILFTFALYGLANWLPEAIGPLVFIGVAAAATTSLIRRLGKISRTSKRAEYVVSAASYTHAHRDGHTSCGRSASTACGPACAISDVLSDGV